MRIETELKLDFDHVLIKPKRSTLTSRSQVDLVRTFKFRHSNHVYSGIPIIAANMDTVGTVELARELYNHGLMTSLHKFYTPNEIFDFVNSLDESKGNPWTSIFASFGILENDLEKLNHYMKLENKFGNPIFITLDVANGYQQVFVDACKRVRDLYPNVVLMAGNVVTPEMVEELILSGVDIAKVGIGGGSACSTRTKTGVGYPQLSAIIECADAAHGLKGLICSDGGCRTPGDIGKAFGAGADFLMAGGMLAGHKESGGEITNCIKTLKSEVTVSQTYPDGIFQHTKDLSRSHTTYELNGERFQFHTTHQSHDLPDHFYETIPTEKSMVKFYGMSSKEAMDKHSGGMAKYRSSEGKSVLIPYRGPVENTVMDILGGLRSTCTYTGSLSLKELSKRTTFVRVEQQTNDIFGKA